MQPLILLCCSSSWALELEPSARGYAELRSSYTLAEGQRWQLVERVRPTLELGIGERWSVQGTAEAWLVQGRYPEGEATALLEQELREEKGLELSDLEELLGCELPRERQIDEVGDVAAVDRLYVDWTSPRLDVRLGRQALATGSALVWNPTDIFQEVYVGEPWRERKGVDALKLVLPIGGEHQLLAAAGTPSAWELDPEEPDWAASLKGTAHVGTFDLSLVGALRDEGPLVGLDLKGDAVLGWWLEGAWDPEDQALRAALGADWSWPLRDGLSAAGQVYVDSGGLSADELSTPAPALGGDQGCAPPEGVDLPLLSEAQPGEETEGMGTRGRLYGLLSARFTISELWSAQATALTNLQDGSTVLSPYLSLLPRGGHLSISAGLQLPAGPHGELHPDPDELVIEGLDLSGLAPRLTAQAWVRASL